MTPEGILVIPSEVISELNTSFSQASASRAVALVI